jgi:hypothetical protein
LCAVLLTQNIALHFKSRTPDFPQGDKKAVLSGQLCAVLLTQNIALHFKSRTEAKLLASSTVKMKILTVAGFEPATRGL